MKIILTLLILLPNYAFAGTKYFQFFPNWTNVVHVDEFTDKVTCGIVPKTNGDITIFTTISKISIGDKKEITYRVDKGSIVQIAEGALSYSENRSEYNKLIQDFKGGNYVSYKLRKNIWAGEHTPTRTLSLDGFTKAYNKSKLCDYR